MGLRVHRELYHKYEIEKADMWQGHLVGQKYCTQKFEHNCLNITLEDHTAKCLTITKFAVP